MFSYPWLFLNERKNLLVKSVSRIAYIENAANFTRQNKARMQDKIYIVTVLSRKKSPDGSRLVEC